MTVEAYPLQWPVGRPRTPSWHREPAKFECTLARARDDVVREVQLLVGKYFDPKLVMSSNLRLRNDGLPLANQRQPDDPGVAVYFMRSKKQVCFSCDRWSKIEHNLRAIAKTIEALRGIDRWSAGDALEAAFSGFVALPPPADAREWWEVLDVPKFATPDECLQSYRRLRALHHPDRGGDAARFDEVQRAFAKAPKP